MGKLTGRLEDWPPKKVNGSCCGLEGGIRVCVWPRLVCAAKNVFWKFARGGWGGGVAGRAGSERKTEGGSWGRPSSAGRNTDTWAGGWAWGHSEEELTVDHILSDPNILQFAE